MPYWNRFDICEAWYCYASDYHSGQFSKLYAKLSQFEHIGFKPSPLLSKHRLTLNGEEIYNNLVVQRKYQ